jgi:hypothetical protein
MHGAVSFFGRVAFLVEQNTQAFYMFITAMLQVQLLYAFFLLVYCV